jgi:hypothetical protein
MTKATVAFEVLEFVDEAISELGEDFGPEDPVSPTAAIGAKLSPTIPESRSPQAADGRQARRTLRVG